MEQRLKKLLAGFLISILTLSITSAVAASPSAKPTPKVSTKETKKPVVKKKATKKPVVKKKAKKKPAVKKKVVKKKKKSKGKKLPRLQPVNCFKKSWPSEFTQNGEVFAKIPIRDELKCEASDNYKPAKAFLRADLKKCDEFACGNVTVASEAGCTWWEVNSTFERIDLTTGKIDATLGSLRTISRGTKTKEIQTIMLISQIKHKDADGKILKNIKASGIEVSCHHDAVPDLTIRNFFTAN
ncbi:unannotated protein [freshwater metagenome]|uniref:Unannotated protein n=1 Tax=freshwater metagenome TaxID=449393 RepID=A0A6J6YSD4_9ZZZZ